MRDKKPKILFIGCVKSSYILLKKMIELQADICGVITMSASTFNSDFVDLAPLCIEKSISYMYVSNINNEDVVKYIKELQPDVGCCFGWSQLINEEIISLFPKGIIGFHPAELPYNRGRHPIIWALVLGLPLTASTFFEIDKKADTGDIVSQRKIDILLEDDAQSLYDKIMHVATEQVEEIVDGLINDNIKRIKQDNNVGNQWRKRKASDGKIDFRMSSRAIYNLVRGLTHPYVGAHINIGEQEIKVWKVKELTISNIENIEPGKVLAVNNDGTIDIKTYDGAIKIIDSDYLDVCVGSYL